MNVPTALSADVTIRPAEHSDRPALEAIAARTWGGDDYLPQLIDSWLADQDGEFPVATLDGERVVGTAKLTRLGEGEWWFEGLRVDPALYGRGIARVLQSYLVRRAEAIGSGVVRLSTAYSNRAVHRLAESTGFNMVAHFVRYQVTAKVLAESGFRRLSEEDTPAVRVFLASSPHFERAQRSTLGPRWLCEYITPERLRAWAAQGRLYGWYGHRQHPDLLDGAILFNLTTARMAPGERNIGYLDATTGNLAVMAQAIRGLAAELGLEKIGHMLLDRPERLVAFEQAGWRAPYAESGGVCLFSRPLRH